MNNWRTGEENDQRAAISGKVERSENFAFPPSHDPPRALFSLVFSLSLEASDEERGIESNVYFIILVLLLWKIYACTQKMDVNRIFYNESYSFTHEESS